MTQPLAAEVQAEIARLYTEEELSAAEIARRLKLNPRTTRRYAPMKNGWRPLKESQSDQIRRLCRETDYTLQEIADMVGCGVTTVKRHRREVVDEWDHPIDPMAEQSSGSIFPDDLPDLEIDEFNWTQEELDDAVREARRLLFPIKEETS